MSSSLTKLRFSEVHLENTDLRMCLLSCPGVRFASKTAIAKEAFLEEDLRRLRAHNVKMALSCLPRRELALGPDLYASAYERHGIDWHLVSIPDMTPPTSAQAVELNVKFKIARSYLAAGTAIAIHCMAGLGRTGTIAARFAIDYGLTGAEAIAFIRGRYHKDAIETSEQEAYLLNMLPPASSATEVCSE